MTIDKKIVKIPVKIIKDDGNFLGYSPLNRGVFASGNTKDEAFTNLKKIAQLYSEFHDVVIKIDSSYKKQPNELEIKLDTSEHPYVKILDIANKPHKENDYKWIK